MSQQWNPLQDLMVLQDRMNRLFEDATQMGANRFVANVIASGVLLERLTTTKCLG